jgi:nucleoid DNA-binding protein
VKKNDLTKQYARRAGMTQAQAADEIDRVIHDFMKRVRNGEPASLPGFGTFFPNQDAEFPLEQVRDRAKRERR